MLSKKKEIDTHFPSAWPHSRDEPYFLHAFSKVKQDEPLVKRSWKLFKWSAWGVFFPHLISSFWLGFSPQRKKKIIRVTLKKVSWYIISNGEFPCGKCNLGKIINLSELEENFICQEQQDWMSNIDAKFSDEITCNV